MTKIYNTKKGYEVWLDFNYNHWILGGKSNTYPHIKNAIDGLYFNSGKYDMAKRIALPKFSVSRSGNYKLYNTSDHGILNGYDGVRTEVNLYWLRSDHHDPKKDNTKYYHSIERQEYLFEPLKFYL